MRFVPIMLSCALLLPLSGKATTLRPLDGSRSEQLSALLKENLKVIVIEEDCRACKSYLKSLQQCEPGLQDLVRIVSISSSIKTKKMIKALKVSYPVYLTNRNQFTNLKGTPTTFGRGQERMGLMTCQELQNL